MATYTQTLSILYHAIISDYQGEENTNDHTSTSVTSYTESGGSVRQMLVFYSRPTADNQKREILSMSATCTYSGGNYPYSGYKYRYYLSELEADEVFNPETVTHSNHGFANYTYNITKQSEATVTVYGKLDALAYGVAYTPVCDTVVTPKSATVNFGDYVTRKVSFSKINSKTAAGTFSANVDACSDNTIELTTSLSSDNVLIPPDLTSVKLRYRVPDADSYGEVEFGTSLTGVLPGNLIPAGAISAGKVELAAACTDSNGGSYVTSWISKTVVVNVFKSVSPASGSFVDRAKAALFSASLYDGCTLSAFKWRKSGATDATTVTLSGVTSYTMPANTITDGAEYEFTFTAVDKYGVEHELSTWRTFTTVDATPTAETVAPSGTMIEADSDTVFTWSHSTSTGSSATKSELQYSADETTWTDLATVTGSATEYTLAAGTLTTGTWYWRVRTYNLDSVASEWSDAAQFIAVGKPSTPLITIADNSPRPTITWQVSEQEGYELTIDGEVIRDYGTGKSWTSPRYLTDGTHTVSIRVQNSYGLWSDMATMSFTVENTAGEAVYLSGTAENSATLNWDGVGYDFFVVYRNGKAIAKTENVTYCDRLYAGDATYYVRGCYTDSYNYGISNEIELEILPKNAVLEGIADGATIDLSLSDSQSRSFTWTQTRQSSSYHTAGRALPSYDIAEYLDQTLSGTCAIWKDDRADQRELESLLGQIVCLKTENGEFALGPLVSLTKAVGLFYVSYQISVVNSFYEEEINLDS